MKVIPGAEPPVTGFEPPPGVFRRAEILFASWRRFLVWGLAAALLLAALIWALSPVPVSVDIAVVERGPMRVTVNEEAKTRIRDVYTVSAPIAGKVLRSPLEAGDAVEKGRTVVAVIQPAVPPFHDVRVRRELEALAEAARSAVALAEAEEEQARSELAFAERDAARARALASSRAVSVKVLEKAELDLAVRQAALARATAAVEYRKRELESANARLVAPSAAEIPEIKDAAEGAVCCIEVRAPASGQVLRMITKSEQVAAAGTALLEIGNPQDIEIVAELLTTDAVKVKEGASAAVENWGQPVALPATVRRVEPGGFTKISALGIEEQRVRVILDFADPQASWQPLGHDFRVYVRITVWEGDRVLQVPLSALFRQGRRWAVFRVENGRARLVFTGIGHRSQEAAEVQSGLSPGDKVVLHPSDRLSDGVAVKERSAAE